MKLLRGAKLSLGALRVHPVRTTLAVAGTAVGVGGVLVLTAVGAGARQRVLQEIEALGGATLVITPAPVPEEIRIRRGGGASLRSLDVEDADALRRHGLWVRRVAPVADRDMIAKRGAIQNPTKVLGTTPDWLAIRRFPLAAGRFFTAAENDALARVAVLGAEARASLFPDTANPVGQTVRLGAAEFRVVGVLRSRGLSASGTATEDDRVIVPLATGIARLFGRDDLPMILVEAIASDALADAERDASAILRARHDLAPSAPADFVVESQRVVTQARLAAQATFQRLLAGLGALALAVGAAGILAILLLSVRERRGEIGLRVAVGARRGDVVLQFLVEAFMMAGGGAALGVPLGVGAAGLLTLATDWTVAVSGETLAVAMLAAVGTGAAAGAWPAWRAASMDPIRGLRTE